MSVVIRTDQVDQADIVDFMRDAIAKTWMPMDINYGRRRDYFAEFRASGLGPMQVVLLDVLPIQVTRSPAMISQADPDMLKMVLVCSGDSCVIEQGGRQARLSPGEFTFYDTRRPYEIMAGTDEARQMQLMTFMFPPSLLPVARNRVRDLAALRFAPGAGLGDVTSQFLLQLARNIDHYSPAEAASLSTAALEVLGARLSAALDISAWETPEARRRAQLTTVKAFIQRHLGDPALSPPAIAAAHHISLRSLQQLFHDEGLTVAGWIRKQRLENCRHDLANPALAARPVGSIGARWGFQSAADFSRTFRAMYGVPPAEYRMSVRDMSARLVKVPAL
ncbi:MAG TPA: helix-turn-helix domain-containing protein [Trebonia sp.]|nr:helix-turn-helix domain-containing protein [Trebonia sp.]